MAKNKKTRQRTQRASLERRAKRLDGRGQRADAGFGSGAAFGLGGGESGAPLDPAVAVRDAIDDAIAQAANAAGCRCSRDHSGQLDAVMPPLVDASAPVARLPRVQAAAMAHVRAMLLAVVEQRWQQGWEPADVLRLARRRLSRVHVYLLGAAVAEQLSRYPADSVEVRWDDQLQAAGWRSRAEGASALADAMGSWPGGWPALARPTVELIGMLAAQGTLPPVSAAPGGLAQKARAARSSADRAADVDAKVLAKVRALLAKAESTDYPAEAETFTAAAQSLMARHSIDAALLAASQPDSGQGDGVRCLRLDVEAPYENAKALLLQCIADANRCRAVWASDAGFSNVIGYPSDLLAVEVLYTSLLVQALTSLTAAGRSAEAGARSRSATFRRSYLHSYAQRIGERLTLASETTTNEVAAGTSQALLPVLAARSKAVEDTVEELFPHVQRKATSTVDPAGWASGRAAADLASLAPGAEVGDGSTAGR
ncbi:Protein of unknown function [Quadrisphaera granulorum]|uniref:Uncharacterized protein DUF2786 n=1 Tax=Quadrisphaera granulorum TaxID=317664 RepID=A0A316ABY9_9ACTN|nr:DUF2786 domain-containing protein [Quadrisphaera granulorum]PWJ55102.1 uncharacterized protein DUF2786 [Quadrisphaera granulorum]SZE95611.1 Protein of unknown function [Quadrisphaera granulorum]